MKQKIKPIRKALFFIYETKFKDWKKKKGSYEEKVRKDYLKHVKNKQKGCGKIIREENYENIICGLTKPPHLCPSCSNQSPTIECSTKDKPEDGVSKIKLSSGPQTLSDKMYGASVGDVYFEKDLKQSIKKLKEEDSDWIKDIIALIEINNYGKKDLIAKMKRLCKAHVEEKDKIFGEKLV